VEVHFDLDVQRVRHDRHIDDATRTLFMQTPVIAGRHERTWRRSLRMKYADAYAALTGTTATISFIDPEDKPRKNIWPKHLPNSNGQGGYSSASQQIPPANT
jgi:hypothetical protein